MDTSPTASSTPEPDRRDMRQSGYGNYDSVTDQTPTTAPNSPPLAGQSVAQFPFDKVNLVMDSVPSRSNHNNSN